MRSNVMMTGQEIRLAARQNQYTRQTSGVAPGYLQANVIILPSLYAGDFRSLCARNPVPCPLIAESNYTGCYDSVKSRLSGLTGDRLLAKGCDLRRDVPSYMVYKDSKLVKSHCSNIVADWNEDHIAFLIGCSYSFESELAASGLSPRQVVQGRNVPMYGTNIPLCPAGVFTGGTYVVSMRPYRASDVERVRAITRRFGATHGEPIDWGWEAVQRLGIRDINVPDWGDAPLGVDGMPYGRARTKEGKDEEKETEKEEEEEEEGEETVPVFWGCGVTPQEAVMKANLEGTVMAHAPGHMLLLDAQDRDIMQ